MAIYFKVAGASFISSEQLHNGRMLNATLLHSLSLALIVHLLSDNNGGLWPTFNLLLLYVFTCIHRMGDMEPMSGGVEWLDDDYLTRILSSHEGGPVKLESFKKKPATSKGENYASAMYLVTVEYRLTDSGDSEEKTISMIVKSRLDGELMAGIEEEFNVFQREVQVYSVIKQACEELLREIGDDTLFGPRAIYTDDRVIVQENLKERGYEILDVKKGLDFEECSRVLEKLAKFHATTMVLYQRDPDMFRFHQQSNLGEVETPLHDLFRNSVATCVEYMKTVPRLQPYLEKLEAFRNSLISKLMKVFTRSDEGVNALNHGDMWVNNLMFKKSPDRSIVDVLLVDYQEGYFGSPGIDLNYFSYTSMEKDVFITRRNELIQGYHHVLADVLTKLNYSQKIPTLDDVQKEIRLKADHGLATATGIFPILINEHPELADPENFLTNSEEAKAKRLTVFTNDRFADLLEVFLEDFSNQGVL